MSLLSATTPSQGGAGSNGNEVLLTIFQSSKSVVTLFCVISRTFLGGGVLSFCRDAVDVNDSPSQLGS